MPKPPGKMRVDSLQAVAHGSDAVMFFQWRGGRFGAEKFHSSMLPASGTRGRVWGEVVELGRTLGRLDEVRGSTVAATTALLWDWESFWAQGLEWRPSVELDPRERMEEYYSRLWHAGITVDFAHPEADLSRYHHIDYRDRWRFGPDGRRLLTLRMILVRVRHLPPESATAIAYGGPGWQLSDFLLAHLFHATTGKPHPALPAHSPIASPEREKSLRAGRARARERQRAIDAGEIT